MKKIVTLLICCLTCFSLLLTSCKKEKNGYDGPVTELKVLNFRVEDKDFYKWFEKEFEKENPDIDIIYESVDTTNYSTLLQSRLTAGEVDVFGSQPTFFTSETYTSRMEDLSDLDIWDGMYDFVLKECTSGENKYIAPTNVVNGVVFYNKKLFADAGITSLPTTWNEFVQVCETLKTHLGGISADKAPIINGLLDSWPINILVDTVEANIVRAENPDWFYDLATGETDMSDPLVTEVMTKVKKISEYFETGATGMQYSLVSGRFATGKYGMMIDGSWQLSQIRAAEPDFEVGTFILPTNNVAAKNVNMCYKTGGGFSVVKGTGNEANSKRFIEFHMRDDVMQKYSDMCKMGPVKDAIHSTDPLAKEFYSNSAYTYVTLAENSFVRGMPGYLTTEVVNLITGRTSVDDAVSNIAKTHNNYSTVWAAYVADWIRLNYPDRV
ncbi:MAG: extracellular solute-binding protein [Clostridia bacterium]|nr:extracellular solute-binding protein [Clostridia bacterium]MBQ9481941.1 extracellular solute-binding protein [Clostridia bacterium]